MARITIVFMIVNGRMYSVTTAVGEMWRELLDHIVRASGGGHDVLDYPPPQPLGPLWARDDKAAVFMCGLPWSLSHRDDEIVAVPVPSPEAYGGQPVYWSYLVVRRTRNTNRCVTRSAVAWRSRQTSRNPATTRPSIR